MIATLRTALAEVESQKANILACVKAMPDDVRKARPSPKQWSPQEIVAHLVIYEELMLDWIAAEDKAQNQDRPGLRGALFVSMLAFLMKLPFSIPTLPMMEPKNDTPLPELEARWQATRTALYMHLKAILPESLDCALALHPMAGPLNPEQVLRLTSTHLAYHQRQVARLSETRPPAMKVQHGKH